MNINSAIALKTKSTTGNTDVNITHQAYKTVRWEVDEETGELTPPGDPRTETGRDRFRKIINKANKTFHGGVIKAGGPGSGRKKQALKEFDRIYKLAKQAGHDDSSAHKVATEAFIDKLKSAKADKPKGHDSKPHHPGIAGPDGVNPRMRQPQGLRAGEENVEMEGNPIRRDKTGNRIKKVGTQFCVESDGVDKNLGCFPSREKAQAVLEGRSFIEPDIDSAGSMPSTGWQYGKRSMPVGYIPPRTLSGFPSGKGGGRGGLPKSPRTGSAPKSPAGTGHRLPNPSMRAKNVKGFADYGEPMAGAMQHAHMDTNLWFTPPSLAKRGKGNHIPTDDPGVKDNKFGDVTKRKQAHKDRMKLLKRSAPSGDIPVRTTLLEPHSAVYAPSMMSAGGQPIVKTRPARMQRRGMFVSYNRRGML